MIKRHRNEYPVRRLCRLVNVSASGYYAWANRQPSHRVQENQALVLAIRQIHEAVDERYGSPRMHAELVNRGYCCGKHRVARLMREHGIVGKLPIRSGRPILPIFGRRKGLSIWLWCLICTVVESWDGRCDHG